MFKKFILFLFLLLFQGVNISAYYNYYNSYNLFQFFESELFILAILFVIVFALCFYALRKSLDDKTTSAVVSMGISFFVCLSAYNLNLFDGYASQSIGIFLIGILFFLVIGLLLKTIYKNSGAGTTILFCLILWFVLGLIEIEEILPYNIPFELYDTIINFHLFITSWWSFMLLSVLGLFILFKRKNKSKSK